MNYLSNIFPKNGPCAVRLRPEQDALRLPDPSTRRRRPVLHSSVRELPTNNRQPSPVAETASQGNRALSRAAHARRLTGGFGALCFGVAASLICRISHLCYQIFRRRVYETGTTHG